MRLFKSDNIRLREIKWENILGMLLGPIFWDNTYRIFSKINYDNRLKYFQFNINRGCLKTNNIISKFVPNQTDRCTFCGIFLEDILHLLWDCRITRAFFDSIVNFANSLEIVWPPQSREVFLFGTPTIDFHTASGYFYLQTKHFLWISRCLKKSPCAASFQNKFRSRIRLDLFLSSRGGEGGRGLSGSIQRQTPFSLWARWPTDLVLVDA